MTSENIVAPQKKEKNSVEVSSIFDDQRSDEIPSAKPKRKRRKTYVYVDESERKRSQSHRWELENASLGTRKRIAKKRN